MPRTKTKAKVPEHAVFYHDDNDILRKFMSDKPDSQFRTTAEETRTSRPTTRRNANFVVQKSNIPKAGNGLFTHVSFKPGALITEYGGIKKTLEEVKRSASKYIIMDDYGNFWDARKVSSPSKEFGRWINDPRGTGFSANAEFRNMNGKGSKVAVYATKHISPGNEIYVNYEQDPGHYWRVN